MAVDIESIAVLLLKARENTVASIKPVLNKYDITEQQWRVIRELHKHGDMNAQKLAERSGILSPSLSRILARFSDDGIVIRKSDRDDLRAQSIRLSAKGKRLHTQIQPKVVKSYSSLEKRVGGDKLKRLEKELQHLAEGKLAS